MKIHDSKQQREHRADIDALLRKMPPEEAEGLREVWELAGGEEPTFAPAPDDVEKALGAIMEKTEARDRRTSNRSPVRRVGLHTRRMDRSVRGVVTGKRLRRAGWVAFAFIVLFGAVGLFWWLRPVTQTVDPGERLAFTLPDGSRVELNSGSRLQYARRFGEVRSVHLLGEAFFDIVEDKRPFVVETFNAQVRVMGTCFGVRAWPGRLETGTMVALVAGRVALMPVGQPERAIELQPGEARRVATDAAMRSIPEISVEDATAWRRGDFVFIDQYLGNVLEDVERRFAVDVRLYPPDLSRKRVSLALRRPENAEAVLRDLSFALGLKYREKTDGFELFRETVPGVNP